MQLRHWYVHVSVVAGVQRDSAHTDAVGEEEESLWGIITRPAISLEQNPRGTGAGSAVGTRQAQVSATSIPSAALIKTFKGPREKD